MTNKSLKILNCLHRSDFGGAQRRVVWVNNELQRKDIETIILFPKDKSTEYEEYIKKNKIRFIRVFMPVIRKSVLHITLFLLSLPLVVLLIAHKIKSTESDIIHVNGATNLQPILAALLTNRTIVWHWNDTLTPTWYVKIISVLLKFPQIHFVVATPNIIDFYDLKDFPFFLLRAPIPPQDNHVPSTYISLHDSLSLGDNDQIIGYVSHIVSAKGAMEFVKAAIQLLEQNSELHAVLIGTILPRHKVFVDSIISEITNSLLEDRIHLIGFIDNVTEVIKEFDIFVFPSWSEACPIVVLQAMQAGNPIAATKVGDVPYMLKGTGLPLTEPKDIDGLVKHTRILLNKSAEDREAIKQKMHDNLYKHYSLSIISNNHYELYHSCI